MGCYKNFDNQNEAKEALQIIWGGNQPVVVPANKTKYPAFSDWGRGVLFPFHYL